MREVTLFKDHELFVSAASLAAHAACDGKGFRQRDLRFFIELFINWVEQTISGGSIVFQNTQVQRYLNNTVTEGYARKLAHGSKPLYKLTRLGLLEMLTRMRLKTDRRIPEHFFFLYYFLSNYRQQLITLIENEGPNFPLALRLEIEELLNAKKLLMVEIDETRRELKKIQARDSDAQRAGALAEELFKEGRDLSFVVKELEKKYPYGLNSRKPLSELIGSVPLELGRYEITTGHLSRAKLLWGPAAETMNGYLKLLEQTFNSNYGA